MATHYNVVLCLEGISFAPQMLTNRFRPQLVGSVSARVITCSWNAGPILKLVSHWNGHWVLIYNDSARIEKKEIKFQTNTSGKP